MTIAHLDCSLERLEREIAYIGPEKNNTDYTN